MGEYAGCPLTYQDMNLLECMRIRAKPSADSQKEYWNTERKPKKPKENNREAMKKAHDEKKNAKMTEYKVGDKVLIKEENLSK